MKMTPVFPCLMVIPLIVFGGIIPFGYGHDSSLHLDGSDHSMDWIKILQEYNKSSEWKVGTNLTETDYYKYTICDISIPKTILESHCYDMELYFVTVLQSWNGPVWIVQGFMIHGENTESMIFQINPNTFEVHSDMKNFEISNSLERTIFSLSQYDSQSLKIGNVWDEIESYFTNDVPLEITSEQNIITSFGEIDTFVLSYDVIEKSNTFISPDFPFPIKSITYDPNLIFPEPKEIYNFELIEYSYYDESSNQVISSFEDYSDEVVEIPESQISTVDNSSEFYFEDYNEDFEIDYTEDYTEDFDSLFLEDYQ